MPPRGRQPKPDGQRVNRVKLAYDWADYQDVPFEGAPDLPPRGGHLRWPKRTLAWWQAVSTMPHCVDWTPTDWQYAFDAANLAAYFHMGDVKVESALRARERVMGTTADYRRALRIRYVAARPARFETDEDDDDEAGSGGAQVMSLDDYRRILEA